MIFRVLAFTDKENIWCKTTVVPASPFLMFLPFICLALPDDSPFWTATENEGFWDVLGSESKKTVLKSPGLVLVNHGKNGTSEIIPGKVYYDDPNYSKLAYNTHFPWEDHNPQGGTSMEYSFRSLDPRDLRGDDINFYLTGKTLDNRAETNNAFTISQNMLFNGDENGVLYSQAIMRKPPNNGVGYIIDLAEITIPGGVIRVDRSRLAFEYELTLGHFGMPHMNGVKAEVSRHEEGNKKVITASIPGRKVALISYHGWDEIKHLVHTGKNAEADESTVLYVHKKRMDKNPEMELMVTVMMHKMDDSEWTTEELSPIKDIQIVEITPSGSPLGASITLSNDEKFEIDFKDMDGKRAC